LVLKLPGQLDRVLTLAQRGNLTIQTSLAPDTRKTIKQLEQSINRLSWMVVAAGLLIAGVNLMGSEGSTGRLGQGLMILAVMAFGWGLLRR
jgi:hypothetical protein